jgi:hypothetical protein
MLTDIATRFVDLSESADDEAADLADSGAAAAEVDRMLDRADRYRLHAVSALKEALPFSSPRLQAIELAPMQEATRSHFASVIDHMEVDEIVNTLRRIEEDGEDPLVLIEAATNAPA